MSKTEITADMVGDPDSPLIGMTLLEDEDRINVGAVYDPSGQAPTVIKSLRLPRDVVAAITASGHPDGFTGVVREALTEWFQRHSGREADAADARQALATLTRLVDRLSDAA
jgi:hypothetical protein